MPGVLIGETSEANENAVSGDNPFDLAHNISKLQFFPMTCWLCRKRQDLKDRRIFFHFEQVIILSGKDNLSLRTGCSIVVCSGGNSRPSRPPGVGGGTLTNQPRSRQVWQPCSADRRARCGFADSDRPV